MAERGNEEEHDYSIEKLGRNRQLEVSIMKRFFKSPILSAGALLGCASLCAQDGPELDLYLQPDTDSTLLERIQPGDPRLGEAEPVMDEALAILGWQYASFTTEIRGFVPDMEIGKDLLPVESAPIYAMPSSSSPILTTYHDGMEVSIIERGAWWTVEMETTIPVYFVLEDTPAPLPPVTATAETPALEELPVEAPPPVISTPAVDVPADSASPGSLGTASARPQQRPAPDVLGQSYEGTFRKSQRRLGLFAPKAPFYLEDGRGDRIAWIDTSEIVIPGSLKNFLDEPVIIFGERDFLPGSRDWIIRARNMRHK